MYNDNDLYKPIKVTVDSLNNLPKENLKRSDISADVINNIESELKGLTSSSWEQVFSNEKKRVADFISAVLVRVESEMAIRQSQIQTNEAKLAALDKILAAKQTSQSNLDQSLVYSIYGMIIALTVLFISLRFFPEALAVRMIQDRSLVEVMSMAFILLTIIILGTGDRIGKEALGTLLGTISGYIFGRKMGESESHRPKNGDK